MALIFPFEIPIYKAKKIFFTYVGNPLVDEYPQRLAVSGEDNKKGLSDDLVIGMLPGSRSAEIDKLLPVMLDTAGLVAKKCPVITSYSIHYTKLYEGTQFTGHQRAARMWGMIFPRTRDFQFQCHPP